MPSRNIRRLFVCLAAVLLMFLFGSLMSAYTKEENVMYRIQDRSANYCREQTIPLERYAVTAVFLYWRGSLVQYDRFFGRSFEKIPTTYEQKDILVRFDSVVPGLESFCLLLPTESASKQEITRLKIDKTPKLPKEALDIFSASKDPFEPIAKVFDAMRRIDKPVSGFSTKEISGICLLYDKDMYFDPGKKSEYELEKDVLDAGYLKWLVTTEKDNTLLSQEKPATLGGSFHFYLDASSCQLKKTVGFKAEILPNIPLNTPDIFSEFNGKIAENYVLEQLKAMHISPISYWTNPIGKAEVDFLIQSDQGVIPIEVKSGTNLNAKSLRIYREKYSPKLSVRFSMQNLRLDGGLLNIPLYLIGEFPRLMKLAMERVGG